MNAPVREQIPPWPLSRVSMVVLTFSLFLGQAAKSEDQSKCSSLLSLSQIHNGPKFELEPFRVFKRIESSGINLDGLRLVMSTGDMSDINVVYKGKNIGYADLDTVENQMNSGRIFINSLSVNEKYLGHGIGFLIYLALAKAAYLNGHILESSYDLNYDSTKIWESLVRSGLAKKMATGSYEFNFEVLSSVPFQTAVDSILDRFKLRQGEELLSTGDLK